MSAQVLVLNSDFQPINFTTWERALTLVMNNKVEVVAETEETVRDANGKEYFIPKAIRLLKMIRIIFKRGVPYSKRSVFIRDNYECQYCGRKTYEKGTVADKPQIEHIMPASRGGKSTWENTVCACHDCNHNKADKTPREAGMSLRRKPVQPTISEFIAKKVKQFGWDEILNDIYAKYTG